MLGPVAAALRVEAAQPAIDAIQVGVQIEHPGHVGIADVAVRDQADPQVRLRLALRDEVRETPDLPLRPLDEPDIEPVVSSANTSSTRGFIAGVGVWASGSGSSGARGIGRTETWGRTWEGTARLWRWAPSTASNVRMPPVRMAYVTIFRGGRGDFGCGAGEAEGVFELVASMGGLLGGECRHPDARRRC